MMEYDFTFFIGVAVFSGCISVAIVYSKTKNTFRLLFAFFVGFLVPILGLIYALVVPKDETKNEKMDVPQQKDNLVKLKELGELKQQGIISDQEFSEKKAELLKGI